MHILSDVNGLPLVVGVSAGNVHDSEGLKPMVEGHQRNTTPAAAGSSSLSGSMRTKRTTFPTCGNGCGVSTSAYVSPAKESSPVND